jgi:PhnB protein
MATQPIPESYHTLTPHLAVDDATQAIEYYKKAFGAKERVRMGTPEGKIGHAEVEIGDSLVMLSDPLPRASTRPPKELGGTSAERLHVCRGGRRGREAGGRGGRDVTMEVADQFRGDRFGTVADRFGHSWSIATHVEDVPPEELAERAKAAMAAMNN